MTSKQLWPLALLFALPLAAAGAPRQSSSEQIRQQCYQMVDEQWQRYRSSMEPYNCTQSFDCMVNEAHKYDFCNSIH